MRFQKTKEWFWQYVYEHFPLKQHNWYHEGLDGDLDRYLQSHAITSGRILDVGTGAGTQATQLSLRGFEVVGTDLSSIAIEHAKTLTDKAAFLVDDIHYSSLERGSFDYIFDRGCMHSMRWFQKNTYAQATSRLLKDDGILFLKCMSDKERRLLGPTKISEKYLRRLFEDHYHLEELAQTSFEGTLEPYPKAWFAAMRKK